MNIGALELKARSSIETSLPYILWAMSLVPGFCILCNEQNILSECQKLLVCGKRKPYFTTIINCHVNSFI